MNWLLQWNSQTIVLDECEQFFREKELKVNTEKCANMSPPCKRQKDNEVSNGRAQEMESPEYHLPGIWKVAQILRGQNSTTW